MKALAPRCRLIETNFRNTIFGGFKFQLLASLQKEFQISITMLVELAPRIFIADGGAANSANFTHILTVSDSVESSAEEQVPTGTQKEPKSFFADFKCEAEGRLKSAPEIAAVLQECVEFIKELDQAETTSAGSCASGGSRIVNTIEPPAEDSEDDEIDEEGKTSRLRLRLSRSSKEQKWGVKWHANMYKKSHLLVVDDVVEGSALDMWNQHQDPGRQIRYGDRLVRVNKVRDDGPGGPATAIDRLRRSFADDDDVSLVFRRAAGFPPSALPSSAAETISHEKSDKLPSLLLRWTGHAEGVSPAVLAVCVAHGVSLKTTSGLDANERLAMLAALRDKLPDASLPELGDLWHAALSAYVESREDRSGTMFSHGAGSVAGQQDSCATESHDPAESGAQTICTVTARLKDDICSSEISPQKDNAVLPAPSQNAAQRIPHDATEYFRCRTCRKVLFFDTNILAHSSNGAAKEKVNYRKWGTQGGRQCSSVFIEAQPWMPGVEEQTGRLACPCGVKLGNFSWFGLECSCGAWQTPAFQVHDGRLDRFPLRRNVPQPITKPVIAAE